MITRPLVFVILCFGFFIVIQSLVPTVMAMENSNVDEYMMANQRTRKRKNYIMRLAQDGEMLGNSGNIGTNYNKESYQPEPTNPEELSDFIVDYANMIRNDVILLDKSVETRTRKRGNIKVGKYNNQVLPDPPCTCKSNRITADLGANTYPRFVETRNCSQDRQQCRLPYICTENLYNITVIRRKVDINQSSLDLPSDLKLRWIAEYRPISVGCVCTRDYYEIEN